MAGPVDSQQSPPLTESNGDRYTQRGTDVGHRGAKKGESPGAVNQKRTNENLREKTMKLKACFMSFLIALGDGRHLLSRQNASLFCRCGLSVTTLVSGSISRYPLHELEGGNSQYGGSCDSVHGLCGSGHNTKTAWFFSALETDSVGSLEAACSECFGQPCVGEARPGPSSGPLRLRRPKRFSHGSSSC